MNNIKAIYKRISLLAIILSLTCFCLWAEKKEDKKEQGKEELKPVIEEIQVTGKIPAQQPISTVSLIGKKKIEKAVPKTLNNIVNQASGVYVTEGSKNEASVQIRGLSSNRIALMYDGIPIYEPYFNSFDLKSFTAAGIENVKIIKGSNSVLYGPNSLGGVINILSERPNQPFLSLNADASENSTYFLSGSGGYTVDKFAFFSNITLDQSGGFDYHREGERVKRDNSDYHRFNISGKLYFYPTKKSEFMAQVLYHTADYGIPAATEFSKARYWRFEDWNRWQVNVGGFFSFLRKGLIKVRSYYVYHYNVLDAYNSDDFADLQWISTYKNNAIGAFMLGEYPLGRNQELKFSLNVSSIKVRQQGDTGEEWESYDREIYSAAIEDHITISRTWKISGGASIDYLVKNDDTTETRVNPIFGIKYTPQDWLDFHLSFARKSRFPSMRSLYSTKSGNPELTSEVGNNFEIGFTYMKRIRFGGALFYHRIFDMVQSYRGLDGYRNYQNIGSANIYGLELELGKQVGVFDFSLNYTLLKAVDQDDDLPLDYTPESQFSAFVIIGEIKGFSLTLWGAAVSSSQAKMGKNPPFDIVEIPAYSLLNACLEKRFAGIILYLKAENIFDKAYFSEPGFPMKAGMFSLGCRLDIGKK